MARRPLRTTCRTRGCLEPRAGRSALCRKHLTALLSRQRQERGRRNEIAFAAEMREARTPTIADENGRTIEVRTLVLRWMSGR